MKIYKFLMGDFMRNIKVFIENLLDKNIKEHGKNVQIYSKLLSEKMKISNYKIKIISEAAYLHDVGKIFIDPTILKKKQ